MTYNWRYTSTTEGLSIWLGGRRPTQIINKRWAEPKLQSHSLHTHTRTVDLNKCCSFKSAPWEALWNYSSDTVSPQNVLCWHLIFRNCFKSQFALWSHLIFDPKRWFSMVSPLIPRFGSKWFLMLPEIKWTLRGQKPVIHEIIQRLRREYWKWNSKAWSKEWQNHWIKCVNSHKRQSPEGANLLRADQETHSTALSEEPNPAVLILSKWHRLARCPPNLVPHLCEHRAGPRFPASLLMESGRKWYEPA